MVAGIYFWMTRAFYEKIEPGVAQVARAQVPDGAAVAPVEWVATELVGQAMGTVRAKHQTVIASSRLSRVEKVHVRAGDTVKAGQLLIELDQRELIAKKAAAMAALQAAKADLELKRREFERVQQLLQKKVSSQRDFDLAKAGFDASRARVKQAQEEVTVVESSLDYAKILAPASGTIIERMVEPGDMAVPGKDLMLMYDPRDLRLEAVVRESLLIHVAVGEKLKLEIETAGLETAGTVEEIVPQAVASTRTFTVKVSIPTSENLYPGMFGRLYIPYGEKKRLLIPASAVRHVGQVEIVELVSDDGSVVRQQVTTGERFGDKVEVLSGIHPPQAEGKPQKVLVRS